MKLWQWLAWCLIGVWATLILWLGSEPGSNIAAIVLAVYGGLLLLVTWIIRIGIWFFTASRNKSCPPRLWGIGTTVGLLCGVLVISGGAFWVRFLLSEPSLRSYTNAAIASPPAEKEKIVRVGLFKVERTEILSEGVVRLITAGCGFGDQCGLVYSPQGRPPQQGEDSYSSLAFGWWQWRESW